MDLAAKSQVTCQIQYIEAGFSLIPTLRPVFSHVLADFGSEVIKVKAPGRGDDLRAWKVHGVSSYWQVYARNRKSITLDFRQKRGRELLLPVTLLFRSASEDQLA